MIDAQSLVRLLVNEVWLSSLAGLAVYAITSALGRRGTAFRQGLWALVLVRLLLPPGLAHPLGLNRLMPESWGSRAVASAASKGPQATGILALGDESHRQAGSRAQEWAATGLLGLWLLAAISLLARDLRRFAGCRDLLRAARANHDQQLGRLVRELANALGVRRRVAVRLTDALVCPFTVGVRHPVIVLPSRLMSTGDHETVRAAVSHELAHVARADAAWIWVQWLVQRLYFFNPVVWLAARQLHAGRETLCDELVVRSGALSPRAYARGLLSALALGLGRAPGLAPALGHGALSTRLRRIPGIATGACAPPRTGRLAAALVGVFILPVSGPPPNAAAVVPRESSSAGTPKEGPASAAIRLALPLAKSRISAPYGPLERHPFTGRPFMHTGIDLVAPAGTPVAAAADGIVEVATTDYAPSKNAGTVVIVRHGLRLKTFYAHLSQLHVREGASVKRGEVLAEVGNTGLSTAPHLHLEVWLEGRAVSPGSMMPDLQGLPN